MASSFGETVGSARSRLLAAGGWAYSIAIGLSACLLFTLELMVGLLLLPLLGGAPSVWATTLGFFQLVLLLGYLYAHLSVTRLGRIGPIVHLLLALAAVASLALGPRPADLHYENLHPVLEVLATLTAAVGLPAFVLCATTPLLSAWLTTVLASSRRADAMRGGDAGSASHRGGDSSGESGAAPVPVTVRDPYRLYVISNAGSLLALLAYPLAIEPALGLASQRLVWNAAFVVLVALLALVGTLRMRASGHDSEPGREGITAAGQSNREPLAVRRVARWLFLAAVPCGLLSAVTNFITADLISAPLLWVGPLGLYLATFIVAFSARGRRPVAIATALSPAMATLLWIPFGYSALWPTLPLLLLELGGFGVVALTLHGALAADRPGPSRLTLFYLVVSAGGVIGGAFVGFLAPVIFPAIWEYPILLVAALAGAPGVGTSVEDFAGRAAAGLAGSAGLGASAGSARFAGSAQSTGRAGSVGVAVPGRRPGLDLQPFFHGARRRLAPFLVIGAACAVAVGLWQPLGLLVMVPFMGLGALILALGSTPRLLSTATGVVLAATLLVQPAAPIYSERDFFGVVAVKRSGDITTMWHGTTPHGSQASDPAGSRSPRGYYDRHGPLGDAMALAQARGGQNIGVIGLGAGVIAAYERPTDNMTFFEIDPAVVRAAEDPSLFTYLAQAPNRPTVVIGDGRLELRTIPNATYDVLILDAFSGDSIPTHLITVEALRDDLRVLKPNGLLMVHVSNRYYDLAPAVAAGARDLGMTSLVRRYNPTKAEQENGAQSSEWVVAAVDAGQLAQLTQLASAGWEQIRPADQAVTDDYPDVLRFARFGGWFASQ